MNCNILACIFCMVFVEWTLLKFLPDLSLSGSSAFRLRRRSPLLWDRCRSWFLCRSIGSSTATKLRPNSKWTGYSLLLLFRILLSKVSAHLPSPTMASFYKGTVDGNISPVPVPSTLYIPIASPPTPAPSPSPFSHNHDHNDLSAATIHFSHGKEFQQFAYDPARDFSLLNEQARLEFLDKVIAQCTLKELSHISALINPLLKHDFLQELPTELALHILSYVDDLYELVRNVAGVCKHWRRLSNDDWLWRRMCRRWEFEVPLHLQVPEDAVVPGGAKRHFKALYLQSKSTPVLRPPLTRSL